MKKLSNKKVLLAVTVVFFLMVLSGCQSNMDPETHRTLAEKIIYLTTTWGSMWESEGLFTAVIVYPLAQCINFLSQFTGVAAAIALTTILLNVITFGLSKKSTVDMQKIQALQPEMQRIQEKYAGKDDDASKMKSAQEMQALYAKHNVNPLGSMIVPFLQMPIMIAMYYAVQRADAVCNGTVFGTSLQLTPADAIKSGEWVLLAIFVLMAVSQFLSTKIPQILAKKKAEKDHRIKSYDKSATDPNKQNNMMMYGMLLMICFIGFTWPTAMSLYWMCSSLVNVVKTIAVQKRYIDHE